MKQEKINVSETNQSANVATKNIEIVDYELSFSLKGKMKPVYKMTVSVPSDIDVQALFMKSTQSEKYEMKATKQELPKNEGFPVFDKKGNMVRIATSECNVLDFVGQAFDPVKFGPDGTWVVFGSNGAGTRQASSQASIKPGLK